MRLRDLPIRRKLVLIVMLTSAGALLLAVAGLGASELLRSRRELERDLATLAEIVAKEYKLDLDVAKSAVRNLVTSKTQGVPYWGEGQIHMAGLKRMIEAQKAVGAITGDVDYNKIIDTRFLPPDLQAIKQ